jgi:hypothetical protein
MADGLPGSYQQINMLPDPEPLNWKSPTATIFGRMRLVSVQNPKCVLSLLSPRIRYKPIEIKVGPEKFTIWTDRFQSLNRYKNHDTNCGSYWGMIRSYHDQQTGPPPRRATRPRSETDKARYLLMGLAVSYSLIKSHHMKTIKPRTIDSVLLYILQSCINRNFTRTKVKFKNPFLQCVYYSNICSLSAKGEEWWGAETSLFSGAYFSTAIFKSVSKSMPFPFMGPSILTHFWTSPIKSST